MASQISVLGALGNIFCCIFGILYSSNQEENTTFWKLVFLFPVLTSLLRILLTKYYFKFEPYQYYIEQNDTKMAEKAIAYYNKDLVKA